MNWRRLVWVYHRDVGYFLTGLVVIYSISGIAVNHVADWNPSYSVATTRISIGPIKEDGLDALEKRIVGELGLDPSEIKGRHRPSPEVFRLFLTHGGEARVLLATGKGVLRIARPRTGLLESNVLHLNHLKGAWTVVADLFCLLLIGLAVTGLFILKGREGFWGRGKWFVGAGFLLPAAFMAFYHFAR